MKIYTQEQLEAMNDFKLNKLIALLGGSKTAKGHCNAGVLGSLKGIVMTDFGVKDYCNNWADMGPLLKPNNITIVYDHSDATCAVVIEDLTEFIDWGFDVQCFNENELRAAAIVYILINQGEK